VAGTVTIAADNAPQKQIGILVLGYGRIYQGGYIFSINDVQGCNQTVCTGSIGGKVVAPTDEPVPFVWDSSTSCIMFSNCFITNADSAINGPANTNTIYNVLTAQNGLVANTYGAGFCHDALIGPYTDWYLPAICEMGDTSIIPGIDCAGANKLQNIQTNLAGPGIGSFQNAVYLSSTEDSVNPQFSMWSQSLGLFPTQSTDSKNFARNLRCVRAF
jgi:hypothetical protein